MTNAKDTNVKDTNVKDIDLSAFSPEDRAKVSEFEDRVEAMVKSTGGDYALTVRPGSVWSMNVERRVMTYPVQDLIAKGIDATLGYALHEGGHRDITRVVDKFWYTRETLRALYNVVEDPRVNTYEEAKWAGGSLFLSKTYELEWPEVDVSRPFEYYDDYKVLPHLQLLNSVIYHYRYGVIDPRVRNDTVKEVFRKTIDTFKLAYSKHPPIFRPTEGQKRSAQMEMSNILKEGVLQDYERVIRESASVVESGIKDGRIPLSFGGVRGLSGVGALSSDELTQQCREYIDRKSKKLADELEAKISRRDIEQIKKELAKEKKSRELDSALEERAGSRIQSLKDLVDNKIVNDRLRESQMTEWDRYLSPVATLVTTLTGLLENELTKDERPEYRGYYRTGKKINLRKYFQYKASGYNPAYEKFWMQKELPKRPSINFTLALDESGSMVEGERDINALESLVLFIEVLNHFDLLFNVIGFSDTPYVHKEFGEDITPSNKDMFIKKVFNHMGSGATDDSSAVEMAVNTIIKESDADHKVVIVISDGEGNTGKSQNSGTDSRGHYYNFELTKILEKADMHDIDVIGIGIGEGIRYVPDIYGKAIVEQKVDHLPQAFADLLIEKILEEDVVHSNAKSD